VRVKGFIKFFLCTFSSALILTQYSLAAVSPDNQGEKRYLSKLDIEREAIQYVEENFFMEDFETVKISVNEIDPRLKLHLCDKKLSLSQHGDNHALSPGRNTLLVRCSGQFPWSLYVPITINAWKSLPVLKGPVSRGQVIRTQDIHWKTYNLAKTHGIYIDNAEHIVGKAARRTIAQNTILYPKLLLEPNVISKGDKVQLVAQIGSIIVTSNGVAKESGKAGTIIDVENLHSKRVVAGQIVDNDTVQLIW